MSRVFIEERFLLKVISMNLIMLLFWLSSAIVEIEDELMVCLLVSRSNCIIGYCLTLSSS